MIEAITKTNPQINEKLKLLASAEKIKPKPHPRAEMIHTSALRAAEHCNTENGHEQIVLTLKCPDHYTPKLGPCLH